MDLLNMLGGLLGGSQSGQHSANAGAAAGGGLGGLESILGPQGLSMLGGLAASLLAGKKNSGASAAGSGAGGLGDLFSNIFGGAGGQQEQSGALPWDNLKKQVQEQNATIPNYGQREPSPRDRTVRMIRALIYAARADGHIDDKEKSALADQISQLNLGPKGKALVQGAMNEPLDPSVIADGVATPDEALQLYTLSLAAIDVDNNMERRYLDSLAGALGIPQNVQSAIEAGVKKR